MVKISPSLPVYTSLVKERKTGSMVHLTKAPVTSPRRRAWRQRQPPMARVWKILTPLIAHPCGVRRQVFVHHSVLTLLLLISFSLQFLWQGSFALETKDLKLLYLKYFLLSCCCCSKVPCVSIKES